MAGGRKNKIEVQGAGQSRRVNSIREPFSVVSLQHSHRWDWQRENRRPHPPFSSSKCGKIRSRLVLAAELLQPLADNCTDSRIFEPRILTNRLRDRFRIFREGEIHMHSSASALASALVVQHTVRTLLCDVGYERLSTVRSAPIVSAMNSFRAVLQSTSTGVVLTNRIWASRLCWLTRRETDVPRIPDPTGEPFD